MPPQARRPLSVPLERGAPVDRLRSPLFSAQFRGTVPAFEAAFAQLRGALEQARIADTPRYKVELAFEEIVANIVRYAAPPDGGVADIRVAVEAQDDALVVTFDDDGAPFDPRARPDPIPAGSLDEARIGGLGIMLVRHAARAIDYLRTQDERNRLIVTIALAESDESICQNARAPNR
jgi:serine/threonine-protein kinase RsbW